MTFEAKTTGPNDLKAVVGAIATLVEEATFEATTEGISFKGMDPSHIALIDVYWPNSAFASYICDSEVRFGVRIDEMAKLIRRASKNDDITITLTEDNSLQLSMGSSKRFKMRLVESSASEAPLPKLTFDAKIKMPPPTLDKVLGDVSVVTDYVTIQIDNDTAVFSGKGDSGEASIDVPQDEEASVTISAEQQSEGTYSLEYLTPVVKAVSGASSFITCEFSNKKPLRVGFDISNVGHIHFYMAPRTES
ncbi:MAG: proliferating cell nuclear antigen (pcna) [Cenarchaeum sp. SB0665_bin_23]|nr:proliferating cell nuclear antigen (pcna) [Cenarchaeum sp. SB0667_bin_13]MXY37647.1 proliferating cell nuclear antigen (pcna) [Cenarchaeum sp. SB0664_bin_35]MXY60585.1 proliferating cell nuclear antigen (pcna) [Cenarchaeum sp. SB0665_bin_23]MXZ93036.1 proliferating cell nuclear antigen (pcna) [Cenarchaeum sp. SB0666_bin_15]MYB46467.1 proliferating cell nuclear antigen (pcna) [Cenarchaeum sp. SB0662_bin_33]MYC79970.1 proliferating cell nuclear antigen (pcna) [Cenarchaeum sp. SB0661_bin_35]M